MLIVVLSLCFIAGVAFYHTLVAGIALSLPTLYKLIIPAQAQILAFGVFLFKNPVHSLLALISVFFYVALFMLVIAEEFLAYLILIVYVKFYHL